MGLVGRRWTLKNLQECLQWCEDGRVAAKALSWHHKLLKGRPASFLINLFGQNQVCQNGRLASAYWLALFSYLHEHNTLHSTLPKAFVSGMATKQCLHALTADFDPKNDLLHGQPSSFSWLSLLKQKSFSSASLTTMMDRLGIVVGGLWQRDADRARLESLLSSIQG